MTRTRTAAAAFVALSLFAAACGGGDDDTDATTTSAATPSSSTTSTTVKPTTTTTPATTTTIPEPTFPLLGTPVTDVLVSLRRALVAKIDNHPSARPQTGLNQADIVFEENVEQLTRFAAVFHSNAPDVVGPVRSGRTQDINLLSSLNKPLLVWSGGNGAVTAAINASTLVNMSASLAPGYFRSGDRSAPHNLYATTADIWANAPEEISPPPSQFDYLEPDDEPAEAPETAGVKVSMDGVRVAWLWEDLVGRFARLQNDVPHVDSEGEPILATNVVVMFVEYRPSPADANSPEAQTVGSGEVWIYTNGTLQIGTWERPDLMQPWTFTNLEGDPIELTPGNTWVELARSGKGADIPAGTDPATIGYP